MSQDYNYGKEARASASCVNKYELWLQSLSPSVFSEVGGSSENPFHPLCWVLGEQVTLNDRFPIQVDFLYIFIVSVSWC